MLMRTNFLTLFVTTLCLFVMGCSKEDGAEKTIVPSATSINEDWQGLHIYYYITNSSGTTTNEFQYGEDIVLHLHVTNNTDTDFIVNDLPEFLKKAFLVYNSDDSFVAPAYDAMHEKFELVVIPAHTEKSWQYAWIDDGSQNSSSPYMKIQKRSPLAKGTYYTTLSMNNSQEKLYFIIK